MPEQLLFFDSDFETDKFKKQIKELLILLKSVRNKNNIIHGKGWHNLTKALNLVKKIKLR